jgi:hypothetical protein
MSEEWTAAQCADAWGVPPRTWHSYVARDQAPKPTRHVGRTPLWDADTVRTYPRPGQGARTDLTRPTPRFDCCLRPMRSGEDMYEMRSGNLICKPCLAETTTNDRVVHHSLVP